MADYNTRGEKHNQYDRNYDFKYNKAVAWNDVFDTMVKDRLKFNSGIKYSDHLNQYDKEGNRTFDTSEISIRNLEAGDVVEIETEYNASSEIEMIRKAVIRLPKRKDGEQIVAVADFSENGMTTIKTAYLNKASDNHQIGLDASDIDRNIGGKFGVKVKGMLNDIYVISNGVATKVDPKVNNNNNKKNKRRR